jgi:phycocyanin-associated rod linker protein
MAALTEASRLGIRPFAESAKVELRLVKTAEDVQSVIWAAYRQVLGNEHLFDSERLSSAESLLLQAQISVRGFVRAMPLASRYASTHNQNCIDKSSFIPTHKFASLN